MLFEDEERTTIKIKVKPGILDLARDLYKGAYPFSTEFRLDDLFEEIVTKLATTPGFPKQVSLAIDKTDSKTSDMLDIGELLRG